MTLPEATAILPQAALPFVNWLFWSTLASGTLGVVAATELLGGTTRGYRLFMAAFVVACAVILVLSNTTLPGLDASPRTALVLAFGAGSVAYLAASIAKVPRRGWLGVGVAAIGLAATASLGLSSGGPSSSLFLAQLTLGTVALGAVTAAMLLGHWYLVTPRLSPLPLRRMMWLLLVALGAQAVLFAVAALVVEGEALGGALAWLAWLRLGAGTLLPIVITTLAILASRGASLQASTGLLYIGLALIAAGTIGGTSITYLTGVPL